MVSGPAFEPHQLDSDGEVRAVASEYHCILATTEFSGFAILYSIVSLENDGTFFSFCVVVIKLNKLFILKKCF